MISLLKPKHLIAVSRGHEDIVKTLLEFRSDASLVDGYGRSAFDWAATKKPLFNKMEDWYKNFRPTPVAERSRRLRQTLKYLGEELIRSNEGHFMYQLGRCLIYLGDVDAALTAFEQRMTFDEEKKIVVHLAWCDLCGTSDNIQGDRYICKFCPDTDLCGSCKAKYDGQVGMNGCQNHEFMKVPKENPASDDASYGKLSRMDQEQWLQALLEKYKVDDE